MYFPIIIMIYIKLYFMAFKVKIHRQMFFINLDLGLISKIILGSTMCFSIEFTRKLHSCRLSLPPANEVSGKVMFLLLSVSHSVHSSHRSGRYASYWNAYLLVIFSLSCGLYDPRKKSTCLSSFSLNKL